jgi:hypothetical protein
MIDKPQRGQEGERASRGALHGAFAVLLELGIEWMVKLTGRRIRRSDAPWLNCFLGEAGLIGTGIYQRIADREQLKVCMPPTAGLIPDFQALRGPSFDPGAVDSRIQHFYEHAAEYHLEVWSEVYFVGRFFLWLLVEFLSRRMDQLNFPISSLELAKGMTSEVVQLYEPATERVVSTGWLRRMKSTGRVIYAGIYSTTRIPCEDSPCVKVTFPCRGSANVYLRPVSHADGSFGLDSSDLRLGNRDSTGWWNRGRSTGECGISRRCMNCSGCMWIRRECCGRITRFRLLG